MLQESERKKEVTEHTAKEKKCDWSSLDRDHIETGRGFRNAKVVKSDSSDRRKRHGLFNCYANRTLLTYEKVPLNNKSDTKIAYNF